MSNGQKRRGKNPVAQARASSGSNRMTYLIVAGVVAVAVVVGVLIAVNRGSGSSADDAAATPSSTVTMPANTVSDTAIVLGQDTAKAKVELYVDLQCPACKAYEGRVASTLEEDVVAGKVQVLVHPVAILDDASSTKYSSRAGAAVFCAADEGKYWPYAKLLYEKQPAEGSDGLPDSTLVELGTQVGLTSKAFATCVTTQAKASVIAESTTAATKGGLSGTPTIKVNGTKLEKGTLEELKAAIAAV